VIEAPDRDDTRSGTAAPTQTPWRVLGGPLGTHTSARAGSARGIAQFAVLLAALPILAALGLRGWCLSNGFGGQGPLWRVCYSDLPFALGSIKGSQDLAEPFVTASVMRVVALAVRGSGESAQTGYVLLWALVSLLAVALLAMAITAYHCTADPGRRDRALLLVLCPALATALLISADIVGVVLAVAGLLAWRRRRDLPAGVLLGAAVLAKSYALILVIVVVMLAVRTRRGLGRFLAGLGGTVAVLLALAWATGWGAVTTPLRQWWEAIPSYGSLALLPTLAGRAVPSGWTPWIALAGWAVAIALVLWLVRVAWRPPALADLALFAMAIVLILSTSVPVQAALWLAPLVALSSLTWRDMLIWAGTEVLYFPMVWLYIGGLDSPSRGLPAGWYALFLLIRLVGIGYLAFRVAEEVRFGGMREGLHPAAAPPVPAVAPSSETVATPDG